jgi:hypothetical protein
VELHDERAHNALNEDFNLSTPTSTTVLALAELIWDKIKRAGCAVALAPAPASSDGRRRTVTACPAASALVASGDTTERVMVPAEAGSLS